jgi:hypothetical protein
MSSPQERVLGLTANAVLLGCKRENTCENMEPQRACAVKCHSGLYYFQQLTGIYFGWLDALL